MTAQLQQLANLHSQGVLSDEEFASAKAKLLAG
ncbi:MAG: SHOCT domain-containing protein [Candidatus Promineifilaceae bacterium]